MRHDALGGRRIRNEGTKASSGVVLDGRDGWVGWVSVQGDPFMSIWGMVKCTNECP